MIPVLTRRQGEERLNQSSWKGVFLGLWGLALLTKTEMRAYPDRVNQKGEGTRQRRIGTKVTRVKVSGSEMLLLQPLFYSRVKLSARLRKFGTTIDYRTGIEGHTSEILSSQESKVRKECSSVKRFGLGGNGISRARRRGCSGIVKIR